MELEYNVLDIGWLIFHHFLSFFSSLQASDGEDITVAFPTLKANFYGTVGQYKADGVTETLNLKKFKSTKAVQEFVNENVRLFMVDGSSTLISFLYSVMLTRGLSKIKSKYIKFQL